MTERIAQVYLIRLGDTDYFKVGVTIDINARIAGLQTSTPFDLHLVQMAAHPNAYTVEKDMHASLDKYHVRNEWFLCPQEEIVKVFDIVSAMALIDRVLDDPELEQEFREVVIKSTPAIDEFTVDKDRRCAIMLQQGYSYRQIGRELEISHSRIANVSRLLQSTPIASPIIPSDGALSDE